MLSLLQPPLPFCCSLLLTSLFSRLLVLPRPSQSHFPSFILLRTSIITITPTHAHPTIFSLSSSSPSCLGQRLAYPGRLHETRLCRALRLLSPFHCRASCRTSARNNTAGSLLQRKPRWKADAAVWETWHAVSTEIGGSTIARVSSVSSTSQLLGLFYLDLHALASLIRLRVRLLPRPPSRRTVAAPYGVTVFGHLLCLESQPQRNDEKKKTTSQPALPRSLHNCRLVQSSH